MHANRASLDDLGVFALMAKALALKPPVHDPFERGNPARDATAIEGAPPRRGLLERIDHWFWKRSQRALEAYLGQASDVYDLEVRISDLERGRPGRQY
jgi:hypothetical protein